MASVTFHRVGPNDTLPEISLAYYGTDRYAAAIYDHNRHVIGLDPNHLNAGQDLILPRIGALRGV